MKSELSGAEGTAGAFTLCMNRAARRDLPWTKNQDAILSDAGFAVAKGTITGWPGYAPTPLVPLPGLARELGVAGLWFKDEGGRFGLGSFKALGGAYAVARLLQAEIGRALGRAVSMTEVTGRAYPEEAARITVCCATDGNHGRSVAWGARSFGCACVIFIHATVSEERRAAIACFGAVVRRCEGNYDDSVRLAQASAASSGWFVVSDTSYEGYMDVPKDVMQGYEIMAAEVFDALDAPPTHLFLQTGVGGMAAAVVAQAKRRWGSQRPTVVLADPEKSACWLETIRAGTPTSVGGNLDTLMAGLACGEVSALAWEVLRDHGDAVVAVTDEAAVAAMRDLACPPSGDAAIVAGESAVAGLAALRAVMGHAGAREALGLGPASRVMLFGTEGDTDPGLYAELVGMTAEEVRQGGGRR